MRGSRAPTVNSAVGKRGGRSAYNGEYCRIPPVAPVSGRKPDRQTTRLSASNSIEVAPTPVAGASASGTGRSTQRRGSRPERPRQRRHGPQPEASRADSGRRLTLNRIARWERRPLHRVLDQPVATASQSSGPAKRSSAPSGIPDTTTATCASGAKVVSSRSCRSPLRASSPRRGCEGKRPPARRDR